jgi:Zn-dependent peptidase ImmA (M78 family)/transcriptional regulator with XRE-family HTH domain
MLLAENKYEMRRFNREMLTLARESRGWTQTDMAERLGIAQATISKIENGLREPTDEQIRRFASFLGYTPEFFFLTDQIRSFGSGCTYRRARQRTAEARMKYLLGIINVRRIQIGQLLESVELNSQNEFVRLDVDEHGGPVKIAQRVRAMWKLPPGPIQNLTRAIEDAGGIIFRCDFGTRDVDAISQFLPGGTPLFLVNAAIPPDRLRFTLAHEAGHIVMHEMPNDFMEKEADAFAAELLMPAAEIRTDLIDVSLSKLATLKGYWKVSMNALLKRAGDLKTITERRKQSMWTQMGKLGFRKHEPVSIPAEEPTLLDEMIATYSTDLGYNLAEISTVLHESEERIRDVFLPKKFKLKLVNFG